VDGRGVGHGREKTEGIEVKDKGLRSTQRDIDGSVYSWCEHCQASTPHEEILPDVEQCLACLSCVGPVRERLAEACRTLNQLGPALAIGGAA